MILLKIVHLLALVFGSAASLGNVYIAYSKPDADAAPFANRLRKLFRFTALGAILVLWLSGIALLHYEYGTWLPGLAFNTKILLAILLTAIILYLNAMASRWARSGGPPSHVPPLHKIGAGSLVLIVVLAALAFG